MVQSFVVGGNDPSYKVGSTCIAIYMCMCMYNIELRGDLFTIICTSCFLFA